MKHAVSRPLPCTQHVTASRADRPALTRLAVALGALCCLAPVSAAAQSVACEPFVGEFSIPVGRMAPSAVSRELEGLTEYDDYPEYPSGDGYAEAPSSGSLAAGYDASCIARTLGAPLASTALNGTRAQLQRQWARQQAWRLSQRDASAANGTSWRFFFEGVPQGLQLNDPEQRQRGLRASRFDLQMGADRRLNDQWAVGGHVGLSETEIDWRGSANQASGDGLNVGLHAVWSPSAQTYVAAALSADRTDHSIQAAPYENGFANALFRSGATAQSSGVSLSAGHDLPVGAWTVSPYVRLDWVQSRVSRFTAASGAHTGDSTQRTLGMQAQTHIPMSWGVLSPHARVEWNQVMRWRLRGDTVPRDADLAGELSQLHPNPQAADRSYQQTGVGASALLQGGWTLYADYDRVWGLRDTRAWRMTLGVRTEL